VNGSALHTSRLEKKKCKGKREAKKPAKHHVSIVSSRLAFANPKLKAILCDGVAIRGWHDRSAPRNHTLRCQKAGSGSDYKFTTKANANGLR